MKHFKISNLSKKMKRRILYVVAIAILAGTFFGFQQKKYSKEKTLLAILNYVLTEGHYNKEAIDDTFSERVFNNFLKEIDLSKRYFLQSDVDEFSKYKTVIDNQIKNQDISFFSLVNERLQQRISEAKKRYVAILEKPFDLSKKEQFSIDYDNISFPKSEDEINDKWRRYLKFRTLSKIKTKEAEQVEKAKKDSTFVKKTFAEIEKEARENVKKNLKDYFELVDELTSEDWFSTFVNSIASEFDPHTSYLAPSLKKRFDISMSGKIEGIGAVLQKKEGYVKVVELVSGGPAWKAGELEVEDLILKAAEADAPPVDLAGMRLDKAIEYIKGKKGTEVRLTIKKIDGTVKVISIVRDVVELEETFVKSSIVNKNGKKYGIIHLPKFYISFEDKNYRNSATDMEKELERLKNENVEGIVFDLRNNGGGSLKTAIEISGLFIEKGPIVQVKFRGKNPIVRKDNSASVKWNKPLVVLVNESSASASEIFAGAMQDYKRAVVMGSEQTYGKGTVQTLVDLNRYSKLKDEDLGALKMTIQKFYRINGKSTQLEGIHSDIVLPTRYSYLDMGERSLKRPLANDTVVKAKFMPWKGYANFYKVISESQKRIAKNKHFKTLDENAKWLKKQKDDNIIYLKYDEYKKDIERNEKESEKFKVLSNYKSSLTYYSPNYELELVKNDKDLAKSREIWHKNLKKDAYIEEAVTVLSQLRINQ